MYRFRCVFKNPDTTDRIARILEAETANDLPRTVESCGLTFWLARFTVQCTRLSSNGVQCKRFCPEGVERCYRHGGTNANGMG